MNILILGATGMLGSMVYRYLKQNSNFNITGTARKKDNQFIFFDIHKGFEDFSVDLKSIDYVINCIGITKPYCHDDSPREIRNAIYINSLFPHTLSELAEEKGFKVMQIATDCVYSGTKGNYAEDAPHDALDVYGKTKSLGEVQVKSFLNLRCSIIGPERSNKAFLLEWFLKQPKGATVKGFAHHLWNGVTTLQFAKLCEKIIFNEQFDILVEQSNVYHFIPNNTVNKYELSCLFNKIFDKQLTINEYRDEKIVDRTLATKYDTIAGFYPNSTMESALDELKQFIDKTEFYS